MAAGVGKTYRMLQEGQAEAEAGRDVVVGLVETHGRAETAALVGGLEIVPRRRVEYRGTELEEMDLPALLERAPELALIDELAHSNAPGVEHAKRYEDITDRAGRRHRRLLDRQRPAPREPQRPRGGADRHARARDRPRLRDRGRRRDRPGRPHAGGADRAPAGRQGLSAGARGGRAQPLLPDREPVRAARGGAARGRRGGGDEAARRAARAARHPRRPGGHRAAGDPGAPARPHHAASPSASSAARRARRSGSTASSTCSTSGPTGASRAPRSASSSRRCAASPPCSARTC